MISLKLLTGITIALAAPQSMSARKWEKRVLLVAAAGPDDPMLARQRDSLARWRAGAQARDLVVVEVIGTTVAGASGSASDLRRRYRLPVAGFAVVLIGKDGGAKLRSAQPVSAMLLEQTIDAMPMRRSGGR